MKVKLEKPYTMLESLQALHDGLPAAYRKALDGIVDEVLRFRPKPKSDPAKQRRKKRRKLEKAKGYSSE